ncbi:putative calbindin-32 [Caerostris extrusa]|uniref:Calbindin-32 n=1 Tax=Caerostris extrusa TaxID=172846 RepID=A0AAV4NR20_CAEEX|nr:putative calbindin-32 [Caerostris extrusa]
MSSMPINEHCSRCGAQHRLALAQRCIRLNKIVCGNPSALTVPNEFEQVVEERQNSFFSQGANQKVLCFRSPILKFSNSIVFQEGVDHPSFLFESLTKGVKKIKKRHGDKAMEEQRKPRKSNSCNFMRQFRDKNTRELKNLTATQFMEVWSHYDRDGKCYYVITCSPACNQVFVFLLVAAYGKGETCCYLFGF